MWTTSGSWHFQFGVSSIPTVMVFQNGEIKATSVGYRPKEEIERLLK